MNQRDAIVTDAIDGLLATSPPGLARLDGFPNVKVIVRADWDRSKVALVSGGGSGHEPAHAGFVGRGGLTAAVCGEIFASPTVDAVYAAILTVTGEEGCLLIVKNYSGDRLNFGLAAERARAAGLKVEMVIVADDIALEDFAQPRGIAGTLFVHKIAGSAAESGANLETVAAIATRVARTAKSLGIATTTCSIPGQTGHVRLGAGQAELGLGIHGEPGVERIDLPSARAVAELMAKRLGRFVPPSGALALLINNLGGAPDLEMAVFAKSMLETPLGARAQLVVGPARLMTALDMKGVSISVLPVDRELVDALMSECDAPAWPSVGGTRKIEILASVAREIVATRKSGPTIRKHGRCSRRSAKRCWSEKRSSMPSTRELATETREQLSPLRLEQFWLRSTPSRSVTRRGCVRRSPNGCLDQWADRAACFCLFSPPRPAMLWGRECSGPQHYGPEQSG